jgi:ssDNA thymidine ADP-ribosyltransferase, DarT
MIYNDYRIQNIKLSRGEFMEQSKHLNGYIYHMVHIDNLPSIFRLGALLSKEVLKQVKIDPRSIAHETVQDIRERIFIWSPFEKRFRSLHSYIPFYFAVRPPMLHVQKKRGIQDEIVIFAVHHTILREPGVLFTNGNATNQQLSQLQRELVDIVPAIADTPCRRRYRPGGQPYGTNPNRSDFFCGVELLDKLNWFAINGGYIEDWDEHERLMSAEVICL